MFQLYQYYKDMFVVFNLITQNIRKLYKKKKKEKRFN